MHTMEYTKLLFVFLMITLLTISAARRHGERLQFQDSLESGEFENDQRPGNAHRKIRNNRGRGGYHQAEMSGYMGPHQGQMGFNLGLQDGYPIRGPVQQPLILAPSNGRGGRGPHRFAEPQNNFQQQPTPNFPQPNDNNFQQQPINNFQRPPGPTQYNQGPQNNFQQLSNNFDRPQGPQNTNQTPPNNNPQLINNFERPQNNSQGKPNNFPLPANNFQGRPIIFPEPSNNPANNFQEPPITFPQPPNNTPIQTQPSNYSPNNGVIQQQVPQNQQVDNKFADNPFLPQRGGITNQPDTQIYSTQSSLPVNPSTFANTQNPHAYEPVTNELPTTVEPSTTTTTAYNPRRTDLLYGSNLLEADEERYGKSVDDPESIDGRGLFDTAPHCQSNQILVNNKCRLAV